MSELTDSTPDVSSESDRIRIDPRVRDVLRGAHRGLRDPDLDLALFLNEVQDATDDDFATALTRLLRDEDST